MSLQNKSVDRSSRGTSHGLYSRTLSITSMVLCVEISLFCIWINMGAEMLLCDARILEVHKTLTLLQIWFGGLLNAILYNKNHLPIFSVIPKDLGVDPTF